MLKKPEVLTEELVWSDLQAAACGAGVMRRTKQDRVAGEQRFLDLLKCRTLRTAWHSAPCLASFARPGKSSITHRRTYLRMLSVVEDESHRKWLSKKETYYFSAVTLNVPPWSLSS